MADEDERSSAELERLASLVRERHSGGDGAVLADALIAVEPFPTGAPGRKLLARAKAAIGAEPMAISTLIVRAIGEVIELLTEGGRQVVATVPVRGQSAGGVLVRQRLGDREFATHVDAREGDRFVVMLDFGVDATARGTRVSLFKDEREVTSEALRQGRVLLPELSAGRWYLEVRDPDGWVGGLDLVLATRAA